MRGLLRSTPYRITRYLAPFLGITWSTLAYCQVERPLIVIPGILGSNLSDDRCDHLIWGDRSSLWHFNELRLLANGGETVRNHRPCGFIGSVQILGPLKIDAYADLLATLNRMDYREGDNLFLLPYDWRQSNFETAKKLKEKLDSPPLAGKQVDILAHSMGGLVARIYIQEFGGAARVKRLVTMGTPHLGSAHVVEVLDDGWGFWRNLLAGGLGAVRGTILTFPSIYQLLPYYDNCCALDTPTNVREVSPFELGLWRSMQWMPPDLRTGEYSAFLERSLQDAARLREIMLEPIPGSVDFYPLCTANFDTTWRVHWDAATGRILKRQTDKGDGTVHIRSASNGRLDRCRASTSEHSTIFASDAAHQHLEWILRPDRHPFQTKSGINDVAFRIEPLRGPSLIVSRVAMQVDPAAVPAGSDFTVRVGLFGESALANAMISATAGLPARGPTTSLAQAPCAGSFSGAQLCLSGTLRAPPERGPERFEVKLPGVQPFNDVLLVI